MEIRTKFWLFAIMGLYGCCAENVMATNVSRSNEDRCFELTLCASDTPTEVLEIIFQKIKRLRAKAIVLVGWMGVGKSSLIKLMHIYTNNEVPKSLKIGGNLLTTKEVTSYEFSAIPHLEYKIRNGTKPITDDMFYQDDENHKNFSFEDTPSVVPSSDWHKSFDLIVIDTPGLTGNEKDDEETIKMITEKLSDSSLDVVAIVFVTSVEESFYPEKMRKLNKFLGISKDMGVHMLFLHSYAILHKILERGGLQFFDNRKSELISSYKYEVSEDLKGKGGEDVRHFFLDSVAYYSISKPGLQKHICYNNLAKLLGCIATM